MKTIRTCLTVAAFALALATAPAALAQVTSETTTTSTSYNGTVNTFGPDVITVQSDSSAAPVSYSYSKTTTYVDENGNPVSVETVKSGAPVTVFYTQDGDRMIASKVVVHRPIDDGTVIEKKTTSTTTTTSPAP